MHLLLLIVSATVEPADASHLANDLCSVSKYAEEIGKRPAISI